MVFSAVHSYHSANQLFDDTLDSLHRMALATEKEDNESYTFKQMLDQPDAVDFIKATTKETTDHESRDHWTVMPTDGLLISLTLGPRWEAVMTRSYFKSEAIFGFLSPNYTGHVT